MKQIDESWSWVNICNCDYNFIHVHKIHTLFFFLSALKTFLQMQQSVASITVPMKISSVQLNPEDSDEHIKC